MNDRNNAEKSAAIWILTPEQLPSLLLFIDPRSCIVQKIIRNVIEHTVWTQVNEHHAGDMPDNQQSLHVPTACETPVGIILLIKAVTLFIVVFHGHSNPDKRDK